MLQLESLGARVEYVQRKVGGSANLNNLSDVPQPQQSRLIRDAIANPGIKTIQAIASAGGVSLEWLITGEGSPDSEGGQSSSGYVALPFFDDSGTPPVMFERGYLEKTLGVKKADAVMYTQSGDAMAPTIKNGSLVLLDTSKKTGNGVFLVRVDQQLYLQRLQYLPGVGVDIISDNNSYKSYTLQPDQVDVIGQLVWSGGG